MIATLAITPLYAGISAGIYTVLSLLVVRERRKSRISIGDGLRESIAAIAKDPQSEKETLKKYSKLQKAIRAHANFGEFVPFILVLIAFLEAGGASSKCIHGLGITLLLSRLSHFVGLYSLPIGPNIFRAFGAVSTFGLVLGTGGYNVYLYLKNHSLL